MLTKVCSDCKQEKPIEEFYLKNKKTGSKSHICIPCHSIKMKKHYRENKEYYLNRNKVREKMLRDWINSFKTKCSVCEETHPACLEFHHTNPEEKEYDVSRLPDRLWSKKKIQKELDKCIIICSNCHKKLHWKE